MLQFLNFFYFNTFLLNLFLYSHFALSRPFWRVAVPSLPENFHPLFWKNEKQLHSTGYLSLPLFQINSNLLWECQVCEKTPSFEDKSLLEIKRDLGKNHIRITLELKKDLNWSDGKPVTGFDLLFSWKVAKSLSQFESLAYESYRDIYEINVDQSNPKRVYFYLSTPQLAFFKLRHLYLIPQHIEEPLWLESKKYVQSYLEKSFYIVEPQKPGLWYGPAVFSEKKQFLTLLKNPYSGFSLSIPEIRIFEKPSIPFETLAEYDIISSDYPELSRIKSETIEKIKQNQNTHHLVLTEDTSMEILAFHHRSSILKSPAMRKAIVYLLPSDLFFSLQEDGSFLQTRQIIHPNSYAFDSKLSPEYSDKRASQMLDDLGWIWNKNGQRMKDGRSLTLTLKIPDSPQRKKIAQLIQAALSKAGIDIQILIEDQKTFFSHSVEKGNYQDLILYGIHYPIDSSMISFLHKDAIPTIRNEYSGKNIMHIGNGQLSALLEEKDDLLSYDLKKENLQSIQKIINDDIPFFPIFFYRKGMIVRNTFGPIALPRAFHPESILSHQWNF